MHYRFALTTTLLLMALPLAANAANKVKVDIIKNPYGGHRNIPEISMGPDYIHAAGLERLVTEWGGELVRPVQDIRLNESQEKQYGRWIRMAMANANYAAAIREGLQDDLITIGLEANCNVIVGMLAGLKYTSAGDARRIGMIFIDAHGDFNVPETTLSGRLGGMPVAVAAGHALHNLRTTGGLAEPIPISDIVWGGVRDLDPLEADRFRKYKVQQFSVADIEMRSDRLRKQLDELSKRVDAIYVHVDIDVLDPEEVPGHDTKVPGGPSSEELAAALTLIFENSKVVALGIGGTLAADLDPNGVTRQAALKLIEGALQGARGR